MSRYAPIVLFVYNRTDHTRKTIESLKNNSLSKESELIIYSDGPKNQHDEEDVKTLRDYINSIKGFKKIQIIESKTNKGLANSIISGVSEVISNYGKVIILEDDLIFSSNFLDYMNYALDFYENNKNIWSISGYTPPIVIQEDYQEDIFVTKRSWSWGWATWLDRWNLIDWDIKDYNEFSKNKKKINDFNRYGNDLAPMLHDQMNCRIDSWAIRWCYNQFKNNMYTIYATKSFVRNIGFDFSGRHGSFTNKFEVNSLWNSPRIPDLVYEIKENEVITNSFKRFNDLNFKSLISVYLRKIGLYTCAKEIYRKIRLINNMLNPSNEDER